MSLAQDFSPGTVTACSVLDLGYHSLRVSNAYLWRRYGKLPFKKKRRSRSKAGSIMTLPRRCNFAISTSQLSTKKFSNKIISSPRC
ncbi:hypothetical protein PTI98_003627 [Pleurotus ostreatus]|nr:hypothetical protein PTI98_003627 [Pleurotus ostreatus]